MILEIEIGSTRSHCGMNETRFVQRLLVCVCPYETVSDKVTTVSGL